DRQLLSEDQGDRRTFRRPRRDLCGVHAPAGDLDAAPGDRVSRTGRGAARRQIRDRAVVPGRRGGRRRRAAHVHHRPALPSRRSRDAAAAKARAGLRRRLQRRGDVRRIAEGGVSGDGCAALRRRRDGRDDGLRRRGRFGPCPQGGRCGRLCRLRGAEMFHETFPDEPLTVLIDYFGRETTDAVACARRFPELARDGRLSLRMDTPGGRYCEGLDLARSYAVLEEHAPQSIRGYRTDEELRYLVGTGVTAAALWRLRQVLDEAGFPKVRIVASSGFGPAKCRMMAVANAPIDVIGTGSYLPELWSETYATADIVAYDGKPMVKAGREFLLRRR